MHIKDNILDNKIILDRFDPAAVARQLASRLKDLRIARNLTQEMLAARSGVSLGSIKRFETTHEISLKHLLRIALVLDAIEDFNQIFQLQQYDSMDELLKAKASRKRYRASTGA